MVLAQAPLRHGDLGRAEVVPAVQRLARQVRELDDVVVDQTEPCHPGGGERGGGRRAEPADAHDHRAAVGHSGFDAPLLVVGGVIGVIGLATALGASRMRSASAASPDGGAVPLLASSPAARACDSA